MTKKTDTKEHMPYGSPYITEGQCMVVVNSEEERENPPGAGDILYTDPGGAYMSVHLRKNLSLKRYALHVYLNV